MYSLLILRFNRSNIICKEEQANRKGGVPMKYTLKMLRASKNWSQVTAAKEIGVSPDTWGNWERKRSFPDVPHIQKIQKIFNVSYDDITFL